MSNADSPHCRTRSGNPACGAPVRTQHAGDAHPQGTRALVASPVQEPLVVQSLVVELCPCSRYRSRSPKKRGVQARGTRLTTQSRGSSLSTCQYQRARDVGCIAIAAPTSPPAPQPSATTRGCLRQHSSTTLIAFSGSDAAAEASQQRPRRVCRRVAAICSRSAASLLTVIVTYLLGLILLLNHTYDRSPSPSDPDESGGCPKNFTVGESCELIAPAGPGDSGTCDADGRCICQSIGATLGGIVGLLFGAAAAVELFIVGCVVLVIPAVCCPDRRCCCCCGGKGRSAEDENTNLLPEVAGPHVGSSRCSTDQSSIYTPSTDRTSYGSTATTHR